MGKPFLWETSTARGQEMGTTSEEDTGLKKPRRCVCPHLLQAITMKGLCPREQGVSRSPFPVFSPARTCQDTDTGPSEALVPTRSLPRRGPSP